MIHPPRAFFHLAFVVGAMSCNGGQGGDFFLVLVKADWEKTQAAYLKKLFRGQPDFAVRD